MVRGTSSAEPRGVLSAVIVVFSTFGPVAGGVLTLNNVSAHLQQEPLIYDKAMLRNWFERLARANKVPLAVLMGLTPMEMIGCGTLISRNTYGVSGHGALRRRIKN